MKLLNIRLDPEDEGVPQGKDVASALARIYAQHHAAKNGERQRFEAHRRSRFRRAVGRYVREGDQPQ